MKKCNCAVCGKEVKFGKGYVGSAEYRKLKFCSKECYDSYVGNKPSEFNLALQLTEFVEDVFSPDDATERAKLVEDAKECLDDFAVYQEEGYTLHRYKQTDYEIEHEEFKYEVKVDVDFLRRVVEYINTYEREDFDPDYGFAQIYKFGKSMIEFEAQCERNRQEAENMPEEVIIHIKPSKQTARKRYVTRLQVQDEDWD